MSERGQSPTPMKRPPGLGRPGGGPGGPGRGNMDFRRAKDSKKTTHKLLRFLAVWKWGFLAVILFAVFSVLFQTLGPYVLGLSTNVLADGIAAQARGTGTVDLEKLVRILAILGGIYLLSALMGYFQQFILAGLSRKIMYTLRRDIDHKIRKLPLQYFDNNSLGDILSRVTNDVDTVTSTLQQSLPQVFSSILTLVMVLATMLILSPLLTLVGLVTLPLSFFFSMFSVKKSQRFFRGQQKGLGDLGGHVEEMFTGYNVIKAYGKESDVIEEFDRINGELEGYTWKSQFISGLMMPVTMLFSNAGYILVAVLGGISVAQGTMRIGTIQSFVQYLRQFGQPINQLATMANMFQSTIAAAERIFDFLEEVEELPDAAAPTKLESPKGIVAFDHVQFGYRPDQTLIHDLSIELRNGDKIAIVGPTGAGKTTLVNLLLRFYEIRGGRITIDGVDIRQLLRDDLRSLFGMVLQDAWLFTGTVEENIRYGRLGATGEEVRQAAKTAYADSFIRTLPGGYNMELREDAANISQGQRQLLTIARAVLSDPVILILDEATSSVDTRTELLIQKAMARLMENRTSFVIAHRLSTIRDSQMILVLNDGDIVETGNHEELLEKKGFYYNLYNSQFTSGLVED